ncbi:calcium-binding protein [Oscillatoria sp. FACHB-1407]|uniref:calcium-binding protein n=1 Tax=Oscillatoria sp. FACHB-1407 TaxID=2692847 RepID=UPI001688544C|nr:calcium-binding protein [Oscillatoria sp. FACHB-1407]MBD2463034.1 calcium-binding protein [Oscillatoria sp. FACHB-1407]
MTYQIFGSIYNDYLVGTTYDDTIYASWGDDVVYASWGNDVVVGDWGNDFVVGDYGNDYLYGGENDDYLDGGFGEDYIQGDSGADSLLGSYGNDTLVGGTGSDALYGESGYDYIKGYGHTLYEVDYLSGGTEADTFALGDWYNGTYYTGDGSYGYAVITDFSAWEGDKLQVNGSVYDYWMDKNWNYGVGTTATDTAIYKGYELVAIVQDTTNVSAFRDFVAG